ncbi:hypothetical protein QBC34DRAFT_397285 [Podospora aff. communis PSN243]|uniref:Secreted protein n=1 Tax=Podospora aff. communis PSN243 TaxID=3040156 RepID=A0AAV9GX07_9PEZI|nr:hypothetical protein QBC34DRAFT_397285 [Podospora aff. communis PSN243]
MSTGRWSGVWISSWLFLGGCLGGCSGGGCLGGFLFLLVAAKVVNLRVLWDGIEDSSWCQFVGSWMAAWPSTSLTGRWYNSPAVLMPLQASG